MVNTYCDLCGLITTKTFKVSFLDGEHPHCGSQMYKCADVCEHCLEIIDDLSSQKEYSNVVTKRYYTAS